jgi:hypothetical protein
MLKAVLHGYNAIRPMTEDEWPMWVLVALVSGSAFGLIGWQSRQGRLAPVAAGILVGAGLAEAAVNVTGLLAWGPPIILASTTTAVPLAVVIGRQWALRERLVLAGSAIMAAGLAGLAAPVLQSLVGIA